MPLSFDGDLARFEGLCTVEEAMGFQEWLGGIGTARVDLSACTHLHTALLQILLAARPDLAAAPADPFLARWIAPLLMAGTGGPT